MVVYMNKFAKKILASLSIIIILFSCFSPMIIPIIILKSFVISSMNWYIDLLIILLIASYIHISKDDFKYIINLFKFKL